MGLAINSLRLRPLHQFHINDSLSPMHLFVGVSLQANKYRPWLIAMLLWCSVASLKPHLESCLCTAGVSRLRLSSNTFPANVDFRRCNSTMPPGEPAQIVEAAPSDPKLVRRVWPALPDRESFATERKTPPHRVCLARHVYPKAFLLSSNLLSLIDKCRKEKFILKDVPSAQFNYIRSIYRNLCNNQYLRLSEDAVPGQSMFVYKYFRRPSAELCSTGFAYFA